ncbi:uncharacterized protein LOC114760495 [Neltuma alba]|uniref:uncharacterized protein LOC114760495 n=1 Tax=Neltuma alba TaxID=207710 RepID=UPI0010A3B628|nr:uncharacterized protein LOC114760495 [Prosopis alba]
MRKDKKGNLDCYALSLKLERFCFSKCNLSDDSLALCLSHFTNMIHLDLSFSSRVTTLPACVKECHHLKYLSLDHCNRLQHIEEMPPNLEKFSAICCMSLTKTSESRVLYQVLNLQPGKTNFIFPGGKFPENVDSYSRGSCVSFWVRDVFPTIFLWILVKQDQDFLFNCSFLVHVNNVKLDVSSEWLLLSTMKMGHLCICDLQSMIPKAELPHGNKWNHVKVSIKSNVQEMKKGRDQFHLALHVYKQQKNSTTIRFMDPRTTYIDSNSWERLQHPQHREELEDNMPYQDLAPGVANLKAQVSQNEDVNAERAVLPSTWNYDVLATILECFSIECRFVYPIFYGVEPLELRDQTGSYGKVFARLEKIYKHNKQLVQKWRLALSKAANLRSITSFPISWTPRHDRVYMFNSPGSSSSYLRKHPEMV